MASEFRIILLIFAVLALAGWLTQKSWAGEGIHGDTRLTAPAPVEVALIRAAAR